LLGKGVNVVTRLRVALKQTETAPGPVVIDTCPLLGVLSLNAIFACDLLLIPVSADYLALQGAQQVERALRALEPVFKRRLPRRYLLTRFDARRKMSSEVADLMALAFRPDEICSTRIAENVSLAESPAQQLDVFRHAPQSRGARDYLTLVEELVVPALLRSIERTTPGSVAGPLLMRPMTPWRSSGSLRRFTVSLWQLTISHW
jgi:chromosome partitioning protein